MICLSSGCTQAVFLILAVSLLKRPTHTASGEDQRANMQEIGLRFYFGGDSDSGQLFVLCLTLCSQRWTEWMKGNYKNERNVQRMKITLFPQWIEKQRTHTLTHTGLWIDLAFYSLVTQTERKTESMSGSTKTFCVINKAEKEIQAEFTKQLHRAFQEHVLFFHKPALV